MISSPCKLRWQHNLYVPCNGAAKLCVSQPRFQCFVQRCLRAKNVLDAAPGSNRRLGARAIGRSYSCDDIRYRILIPKSPREVIHCRSIDPEEWVVIMSNTRRVCGRVGSVTFNFCKPPPAISLPSRSRQSRCLVITYLISQLPTQTCPLRDTHTNLLATGSVTRRYARGCAMSIIHVEYGVPAIDNRRLATRLAGSYGAWLVSGRSTEIARAAISITT
ncbi:hypothetical protein N656DRAFT_374889 [Canariomyces notabilis]|uniref:Uncharacterized protein n=1 Tax=Canariomyces notabilis TaxID=2074819 RepID=A0AAN6QKI0_9PEZI|nr:hypothetical protein N656DRAFT_374889 [Canariomyces arenarius]